MPALLNVGDTSSGSRYVQGLPRLPFFLSVDRLEEGQADVYRDALLAALKSAADEGNAKATWMLPLLRQALR